MTTRRASNFLLLLSALLCRHTLLAATGTAGTIDTYAGSDAVFSDAGQPATSAHLVTPTGIAFDAKGNVYFSVAGLAAVLKVSAATGVISVVAGNGLSSGAGDGGLAVGASLAHPAGLAFDSAGNLYIADTATSTVRKVDTNGIITTVAGGSTAGFAGDGGAATSAQLNAPMGVAVDAAGNLYIAEFSNNRVRKVSANGIISTVAGNSGSWYPGCGDGGPATNAFLNHPTGVAFDASGNLYIADYDLNGIREVFLYAGYPTLILGNIGAINAGNYSVVITSSYGSVTSAVATLTVAAPAIITGQPASARLPPI